MPWTVLMYTLLCTLSTQDIAGSEAALSMNAQCPAVAMEVQNNVPSLLKAAGYHVMSCTNSMYKVVYTIQSIPMTIWCLPGPLVACLQHHCESHLWRACRKHMVTSCIPCASIALYNGFVQSNTLCVNWHMNVPVETPDSILWVALSYAAYLSI